MQTTVDIETITVPPNRLRQLRPQVVSEIAESDPQRRVDKSNLTAAVRRQPHFAIKDGRWSQVSIYTMWLAGLSNYSIGSMRRISSAE
jgi:hypothetical protein